MRTIAHSGWQGSLLCLLFPVVGADAQELTEASYVGSLEGAAQACAAAFPAEAARYREVTRRLVACRMGDVEQARWHAQLRAQGREYADGFEKGKYSLARHPKERTRQCESLMAMRCESDTDGRDK